MKSTGPITHEPSTTLSLEEAIEYLDLEAKGLMDYSDPKWATAVKLGSGALEQIKREREKGVGFWADRLPGETRD